MDTLFPFLWYLILGASIALYAILDGFDLGVGCLHLFTKSDHERRIMLNAIGPVWDGNEVWLVIVFGGLFVGFPPVYATLCSAFYNLIMILIAGLIMRAVSIEFRSKMTSIGWRRFWDVFFSLSSYTIAFTLGVILANLAQGIPLGPHGEFLGSFGDFFSPYACCLGLMSISVFTMHGAIYMLMKTEGKIRERVRSWIFPAIFVFIIFYTLVTTITFMFHKNMIHLMEVFPSVFSVGFCALFSILLVPLLIKVKKDGWAFVFSSVTIFFLVLLFALGTYPFLIRSTIHEADHSLTIFNCEASFLTMKVILTVAGIGVPLVIGYGFWVYRLFRGKVHLDETSY